MSASRTTGYQTGYCPACHTLRTLKVEQIEKGEDVWQVTSCVTCNNWISDINLPKEAKK